jgi:hypothetical protein
MVCVLKIIPPEKSIILALVNFGMETTNAELLNFVYHQVNKCTSVERIFFKKNCVTITP